MYIEQGLIKENKFWKYLVGSVIVLAAAFVGQIPWTIAVLVKTYTDSEPFPNGLELMKVLPSTLNLFLMLLSFAAALLVLIPVVRRLHGQRWMQLTTIRSRVDWQRIIFAFTIWAALIAVTVAIDALLSPQDYVWNFQLVPFLLLCLVAIPLIPIQTSLEEYLFRGYLMQGFGLLARNRWFPLLMTSLIFGVMHIANPEVQKIGPIVMVFYIGTGLLLGIATLMDDGLELALGFHAANNLIQALLVTSEWSAIRTDSVLKDVSDPSGMTDIVVPVLVIYPLILFIFSKRYRWSGWKEKLTGKIVENGSIVQETNAGKSDL